MENWKDVPEYEGIYEVSDQGRVRTKLGKTTYTKRHGVRKWKQRYLKNKNTKTYNVQISIANVKDKYVISSKRLLEDFIPIIKELIYDDFVGIDNFSALDSKVSEIAMKNFK